MRPKIIVHSVSVIAAVACGILVVPRAVAGQCLEDLKSVQLDQENVVRLRDYFCRTDSGLTQLRVQFHRLNDSAADAVFKGSIPPNLANMFGNSYTVKNSVYSEFNTLISRFADERTKYHGFSSLQIDTPRAGQGYERKMQQSIPGSMPGRLMRTLSVGGWEDFPQVGIRRQFEMQRSLPAGHKHAWFTTDAGLKHDIIWRYMTPSEPSQYPDNVRRYNRLVGRNGSTLLVNPGVQKHMSLVQYVTKDNWPEDFLVVAWTNMPVCGNDSIFYPRSLILDIAVIENVSSDKVTIDAFYGMSSLTRALRNQDQTRRLRGQSPVRLDISAKQLRPGEKLVIPLRLTFAVGEGQLQMFKDTAGAKPQTTNYAYGPEIVLSALDIDRERLALEKSSANFLSLTSSSEEGSCPYLYAWDGHTWISHGKVINQANRREKEMTHRVVVEGLATKFRLVEHEMELTFIDQVALTLELRTGEKLSLRPGNPVLAHRDGRYAKIYYGEAMEFSFAVPAHIKSEAVKSSSLDVTGYYIRYSHLLSEKAARQNRKVLRPTTWSPMRRQAPGPKAISAVWR